jgi:hypothetical protein
VAARRRAASRSYPDCWAELIIDLKPDWLVLRNYEAEAVRQRAPELLDRHYRLARVFDVRPQIGAIRFLPGRGYLLNDACFEVYRYRAEFSRSQGFELIRAATLTSNKSWNQPAYDSGLRLQAHAPSQLEFKKQAGARWLSGGFGFLAGAYANPKDGTDGAIFTIAFVGTDGGRRVLLERAMHPCNEAADRGTQFFRIELPVDVPGKIELNISPGPQGNNSYDWTYWTDIMLETPLRP